MPRTPLWGNLTTRRYSPDEKAAAVRMVRTLRAEPGIEHGTVQRVAIQLGYGTESVRSWVRQVDIDEGHVPEVSTSDVARMKALEQEIRELKSQRVLKRPPVSLGAELDRQPQEVAAFIDADRDERRLDPPDTGRQGPTQPTAGIGTGRERSAA